MEYTENNITYGESTKDTWNSYGQDILLNGYCIGALISIRKGLLEPIEERYQMIMPDYEVDGFYITKDNERTTLREVFDYVNVSETNGGLFVGFYSLEKFLDFFNYMFADLEHYKKWEKIMDEYFKEKGRVKRTITVCPHCESDNTRRDYDFPDIASCCEDCGCDYNHEDGYILLNPDADV